MPATATPRHAGLAPAAARATGLAHDLDDFSDSLSAIGFGVADRPGDLHPVSVPIPSARFAERCAAVAAALLAVKPALLAMAQG